MCTTEDRKQKKDLGKEWKKGRNNFVKITNIAVSDVGIPIFISQK